MVSQAIREFPDGKYTTPLRLTGIQAGNQLNLLK
jgi:hypothetical protein